jgi:hypothetical protein
MPSLPQRPRRRLVNLIPLILAAAAALFLAVRLQIGTDHARLCSIAFLGEVAVLGLLARIPFSRLGANQPLGEAVRWTILLVATLLLTLPYSRPVRVGAGDAQDYATHIADFIAQARHGVFPVRVGQSQFASNGAFNPLRTAPYLQYAGGLLHALTLGTLDPFAVQNLETILSLCAAGFSCYACLRRLSRGREWLCLILALLYVSSPGILALVYAGDMVPSWLTLPYLPLYTFLLVRIAEHGVSGPRLFSMAAVVALIWYIHAPIAMWLSFIALPVVVLRLATTPQLTWPRGLLFASGSVLVFAVLAGFEFVSVAELGLPGPGAKQLAIFRGPDFYYNLRAGWAGFLRPVSADGSHLIADLQLSAPLWVCIGMGILAWRLRGWGLRVLLMASGCLFILLVPVSFLAARIWSLTPVWVDQITDQWPMQRFYPILSAFAPFVGLLALGSVRRDGAWKQQVPVVLLALGCLWCAFEATKFLRRGFRMALPPDISCRSIKEENAVHAIYSVGMLGDPPRSFSFRPLAAEMQLRLLDPAGRQVRQSNLQGLLDGTVGAQRLAVPQFITSGGGQEVELQSPLQLPPGKNSLLTLDFDGAAPSGTLFVTGETVWKDYPLPESASPRPDAAGSPTGSTLAITVADHGGESLRVRFVPAGVSARPAPFAHLNVVAYDPKSLPLHIVEHIPLRIHTRAIKEGWLETPRIYIAGYRAKVDGRPSEIQRSPDGLVMVRVPTGSPAVELDYPGSLLLRASFWASLAGWLVLPVAFLVWQSAGRRKVADGP